MASVLLYLLPSSSFFVYCHIRKSYAFNYGINIELEATCVEFLVSVFMWPQKHFLLKIRFQERSQLTTLFLQIRLLKIHLREIGYIYESYIDSYRTNNIEEKQNRYLCVLQNSINYDSFIIEMRIHPERPNVLPIMQSCKIWV